MKRRIETIFLSLIGTILLGSSLWAGAYTLGRETLPSAVYASVAAIEERTLFGVSAAEEKQPAFSWHGWRTRDMQVYVESWAREHFGFRRILLQLYNQIIYDVLHSSRTYRDLVVGRNRQLYAVPYIHDVCAGPERARKPTAEIDALVDQLQQVVEVFRQRKVPFAIVITPNKALSLPDDLPARICRSLDIAGTDYARFIVSAARKDLAIIDGQAETLAFQKQHGISAFPRGGLHWHDLAAVRTLHKFVDAINAQLPIGKPALIDPKVASISWGIPVGPERDLMETMNLFRPDHNYPVPHLTYTRSKAPPDRPFRLAMVGGSFTHQPLMILLQSGWIEAVRYDYFSLGKNEWSSQVGLLSSAPGTDKIDVQQAFFNWDAVMLEINESAFGSAHVRQFVDAVLKSGR